MVVPGTSEGRLDAPSLNSWSADWPVSCKSCLLNAKTTVPLTVSSAETSRPMSSLMQPVNSKATAPIAKIRPILVLVVPLTYRSLRSALPR